MLFGTWDSRSGKGILPIIDDLDCPVIERIYASITSGKYNSLSFQDSWIKVWKKEEEESYQVKYTLSKRLANIKQKVQNSQETDAHLKQLVKVKAHLDLCS